MSRGSIQLKSPQYTFSVTALFAKCLIEGSLDKLPCRACYIGGSPFLALSVDTMRLHVYAFNLFGQVHVGLLLESARGLQVCFGRSPVPELSSKMPVVQNSVAVTHLV